MFCFCTNATTNAVDKTHDKKRANQSESDDILQDGPLLTIDFERGRPGLAAADSIVRPAQVIGLVRFARVPYDERAVRGDRVFCIIC